MFIADTKIFDLSLHSKLFWIVLMALPKSKFCLDDLSLQYNAVYDGKHTMRLKYGKEEILFVIFLLKRDLLDKLIKKIT